MEEQNNNEAQAPEQKHQIFRRLKGREIQVDQIADQIKAGDDALNKLKVQNLDFILDIPLKVTVELR